MYLKRVLSFGIISLFFYGCATSTNSYNHKIDPKQLSAQILSGERGPYAIQYIKNPSEKVQLAAVEKNARAIQYIKNPTEKVQLVAVRKDPYVIGYIKNPSEKVQLAAVKKDPLVIILHIKNPTEKVQLAAVKKDPYLIGYIKNPSEKVQLAAVKKNPFAIGSIKNPTEKVQLAAVKLNKKAIERIKHPTKIVELVAYGQTKVYMPKLDFVLENNDIIIKVKNQKLTVTNKTDKFLKVLSFSEYKGEHIFSIPGFTIPPKGVKTVNFYDDTKPVTITSFEDEIPFGYAIEYKVGNGPVKTIFKTKKYPVKKFVKLK